MDIEPAGVVGYILSTWSFAYSCVDACSYRTVILKVSNLQVWRLLGRRSSETRMNILSRVLGVATKRTTEGAPIHTKLSLSDETKRR